MLTFGNLQFNNWNKLCTGTFVLDCDDYIKNNLSTIWIIPIPRPKPINAVRSWKVKFKGNLRILNCHFTNAYGQYIVGDEITIKEIVENFLIRYNSLAIYI